MESESEIVRTASPSPRECEDRALDGPASEEKGSKGRNQLDSIPVQGYLANRHPVGPYRRTMPRLVRRS